MSSSGLTEKKMSNKRFHKTEQAILIAYCKLRDYPSAKRVARQAKVSRATLYRHHHKVQNIPHDYEEYLLGIYSKRIRKILHREDADLKLIYSHLLIFITTHKRIYCALFNDGQKDIIKKMLHPFKTRILQEWRISGDLNKMYTIYENEVLGVIETWARQDFSSLAIDIVLTDIMYLTETARQKLLPINRCKSPQLPKQS